MKLQLLREAKAEYKEAVNWYEQRLDGLGREFLDAVDAALQEIKQAPFRFPEVENIRTKRDVRRNRLQRFPYSIIYELGEDQVTVVAIAHARRRPSYWLRRKTES